MHPADPSRPCRAAWAAAALTLVGGAPAAAQPDVPAVPLDSGTVVRVRAQGIDFRRSRVTLAGVRGDTLLLRGVGEDALWLVPLREVAELKVRMGRRPRGDEAARGALIGLAAGGVPTVVGLALAYREDTRPGSDVIIPGTLIVGVLGGVLTAVTTVTGAVIGYNSPRERWQPIAPARLRVGGGPAPGGGPWRCGYGSDAAPRSAHERTMLPHARQTCLHLRHSRSAEPQTSQLSMEVPKCLSSRASRGIYRPCAVASYVVRRVDPSRRSG